MFKHSCQWIFMENDIIENQNFGVRLKEERNRLGFTQEELAKLIDIKPLTLLQYEKGNSSPTMKLVYRLRELGFNVNYMVNGEDTGSIVDVNKISASMLEKSLEMSEKIISSSLKNVPLSATQKLKLQLLIIDQLSSGDAKEKDLKFETILEFISQVSLA